MKLLAKLLSPQAAISFAAKQIGVDPAALVFLGSRVQSALSPVAGEGFELIPAALSAGGGDFSPFRLLYGKLLANKEQRPAIAQMVAAWLGVNDTEGLALKALSFLNTMPLLHMGADVGTVEEFLEQGLFPLLDEAFAVQTHCQCGCELNYLASTLAFCEKCDIYTDI